MGILQISPTQGSGNGAVSIGTAEHTYRDDRNTTARFRAKSDAELFSDVAVISKGLGKKYTKVPTDKFTVPDEGGSVTISGTSNIPVFSFRKVEGTLNIASIKFTIDGVDSSLIELGSSQQHSYTVPGDPGAGKIYDWKVVANIAATTAASAKSANFSVGDPSGGALTGLFTVEQAAGAYLNVSPASLSFAAGGGSQTITIDTNESWTIE